MATSKNTQAHLVYSTGIGRLCPGCLRAIAGCVCKQQPIAPPATRAQVRVGRETKGRAGKGVTVVSGIPLSGAQLDKLCSDLKRRCGSGGTVKDGVIEIQGDHRDALVMELGKRGWAVKRSGG